VIALCNAMSSMSLALSFLMPHSVEVKGLLMPIALVYGVFWGPYGRAMQYALETYI